MALRVAMLWCAVVAFLAQTAQTHQKSYRNYKVYEISPITTRAQAHWLLELSIEHMEQFDLLHEPSTWNNRAEVMVGPAFETEFLRLVPERGFTAVELIADLQAVFDAEPVSHGHNRRRHRRSNKFGDRQPVRQSPIDDLTRDQYHHWTEIEEWMRDLVEYYSDVASLIELNQTYEGRELIGIKVGVARSDGGEKPCVWLDGGMHAREWIAVSTMLHIIRKLLEGWHNDQYNVRPLLEKFDFHLVPVANPDGYVYSHDHHRLWRKTRSRHNGTEACTGVDPNRNWDFHWGEGDHLLKRPCSQIYAGPRPFSEVEIASISQYLTALKPNLMLHVSLHAYGQVILGPWGYKRALPRDYLRQKDAAQAAINAIHQSSGKHYTFGTISNLLYPAAGTSIDFLHERGVPYSVGIELRPENARIQQQIDSIRNRLGEDDNPPNDSNRAKRSSDTQRKQLNSAFRLAPHQIEPTGEEIFAGVKALVNHIQLAEKL